ncbi:MAG: hypothetical protein ACLU3N_09440 [Lachnospiraceae bacterium]
MSGVNYTQHRDGIFDAETMTPMLHFMEAEDYCDYLAEGILSESDRAYREAHSRDELDWLWLCLWMRVRQRYQSWSRCLP